VTKNLAGIDTSFCFSGAGFRHGRTDLRLRIHGKSAPYFDLKACEYLCKESSTGDLKAWCFQSTQEHFESQELETMQRTLCRTTKKRKKEKPKAFVSSGAMRVNHWLVK